MKHEWKLKNTAMYSKNTIYSLYIFNTYNIFNIQKTYRAHTWVLNQETSQATLQTFFVSLYCMIIIYNNTGQQKKKLFVCY